MRFNSFMRGGGGLRELGGHLPTSALTLLSPVVACSLIIGCGKERPPTDPEGPELGSLGVQVGTIVDFHPERSFTNGAGRFLWCDPDSRLVIAMVDDSVATVQFNCPQGDWFGWEFGTDDVRLVTGDRFEFDGCILGSSFDLGPSVSLFGSLLRPTDLLPIPVPPSDVRTTPTADGFELDWSPLAHADRYRVHVAWEPGIATWNYSSLAAGGRFEIEGPPFAYSGLVPGGVPHYVVVATHNPFGWSEGSATSVALSGRETPPLGVVCVWGNGAGEFPGELSFFTPDVCRRLPSSAISYYFDRRQPGVYLVVANDTRGGIEYAEVHGEATIWRSDNRAPGAEKTPGFYHFRRYELRPRAGATPGDLRLYGSLHETQRIGSGDLGFLDFTGDFEGRFLATTTTGFLWIGPTGSFQLTLDDEVEGLGRVELTHRGVRFAPTGPVSMSEDALELRFDQVPFYNPGGLEILVTGRIAF